MAKKVEDLLATREWDLKPLTFTQEQLSEFSKLLYAGLGIPESYQNLRGSNMDSQDE